MVLEHMAVHVPSLWAPLPYQAEERHLSLEVGSYQGAAAAVVVSGGEVAW